MTIVGKILVFLNLLMSVATCALIVIVFTTRTNWKAAYEKEKNDGRIAEKRFKESSVSGDSNSNSRDSQIKADKDEIATQKAINKDAVAKSDDLNKKLQVAGEQLQIATATHSNLNAEVTALKGERNTILAESQGLRAKVLEVQKDLNDQKLLAVTNRVEADAQTAKALRLLNRVEELEKNATVLTNRLNSLGATPTTGSTYSLSSPAPVTAPRDVHGTVKAVGTGGLMVISIGSDSGLTAGNKLEVYRIDSKNPSKSVYLGELVISRTEPKQAAGQFYPKSSARAEERLPKVGDTVSTSLGSR